MTVMDEQMQLKKEEAMSECENKEECGKHMDEWIE